MLSINTNISSLITQRSMKTATNLLNQAVERMSTGYKVNHAKDNAAAYSIITNMDTKIGAYQVAEDNCAMGLDLLTTATESLDLIYDKLTRLRDLAEQASNGTYGAQSLKAINSEANALVDEINRIYSTAEYNGINLLNNFSIKDIDKTGLIASLEPRDEGFIADPITYSDTDIEAFKSISEVVDIFTSGETYTIKNADELEKLATLVNNGVDTTDVTFVLTEDIDLSDYDNWNPIGTLTQDGTAMFNGVFDGNGHKITNLKINRPNSVYQGLFGGAYEDSIIRNLGAENVDIFGGSSVAGLIGAGRGVVENCYVTGKVAGQNNVGGVVGFINGRISKSYNLASIIGREGVGQNFIGGLCGNLYGQISDSFSLGNVYAPTTRHVGGLVGILEDGSSILNSYSQGNITGESSVGGLIGSVVQDIGTIVIDNCIALNTVNGEELIGSFLGHSAVKSGSVNTPTLNITGCSVLKSDISIISGVYSYTRNSGQYSYTEIPDYDLSPLLSNIKELTLPSTKINLQVGTSADESSHIEASLSFHLDGISSLNSIGLDNNNYLSKIDNLIKTVSQKQTEFGAVQNRLESALNEISTQYENLVSSRSTLRDADIAEVSSEYIQQQILQQASATLMATANQAPAIALQLI